MRLMNTTAENNNWYFVGFGITGAIAFVITWVYMVNDWGIGLGLLFGWAPAIIAGLIAGAVWPLILIVLVFTIAPHIRLFN